ncbi:hypothetical protein GX586_00805 [bacterium]|nr:hypothetical protein [bacterium]
MKTVIALLALCLAAAPAGADELTAGIAGPDAMRVNAVRAFAVTTSVAGASFAWMVNGEDAGCASASFLFQAPSTACAVEISCVVSAGGEQGTPSLDVVVSVPPEPAWQTDRAVRWINFTDPRPKGGDEDTPRPHPVQPECSINNVSLLPGVRQTLFPVVSPPGAPDMTPVLTYSAPQVFVAIDPVSGGQTYGIQAAASAFGNCWSDNMTPRLVLSRSASVVPGASEFNASFSGAPAPPASFTARDAFPVDMPTNWAAGLLSAATMDAGGNVSFWGSGITVVAPTSSVCIERYAPSYSCSYYSWPTRLATRSGAALCYSYEPDAPATVEGYGYNPAGPTSEFRVSAAVRRVLCVSNTLCGSWLETIGDSQRATGIVQRGPSGPLRGAVLSYETRQIASATGASAFTMHLLNQVTLPGGARFVYTYTNRHLVHIDDENIKLSPVGPVPYLERILYHAAGDAQPPCDILSITYGQFGWYGPEERKQFEPCWVQVVSHGATVTNVYAKGASAAVFDGTAVMHTTNTTGTVNTKSYKLALDGATMQWYGRETGNVLDGLEQYAYSLDHSLRYRSATAYPLGAAGQGSTWSYLYDDRDNLVCAIDPCNASSTFVYADNGCDLAAMTSPGGAVTTFEYDASGNRTRVVRDAGGSALVTSNEYNRAGQLTRSINPRGAVTRHFYSSTGQPDADRSAYATAEPSALDAGWHVATRDALGRVTCFSYDQLGRLAVTDSPGVPQGRLAVTNTYDLMDRLTSVRFPDGTFVSNVYDTAGWPALVRDRGGIWTTNTFDAAGRLVRVDYPNGDSVRKEYRGNLVTSLVDGRGNVTRYHYDHEQLVGVEFPDGSKRAAGFDNLGRCLWSVDERGVAVTNAFDPLGRATFSRFIAFASTLADTDATAFPPFDPDADFVLDAEALYPQDSINAAVSRTYDPAGNLVTRSDWSGASACAYDALGRVTNCTALAPVQYAIDYSYDAAGNTTSAVFRLSGYAAPVFSAYDQLDRLAALNGPQDITAAWSYNEQGGIAALSVSNQGLRTHAARQYDAAARLAGMAVSTPHGECYSAAYTCNEALYVTQILERAVCDGHYRMRTNTFAYDARNQLADERIAAPPGQVRNEFLYDHANNRTRLVTTSNGVSRTFTYDFLMANKAKGIYADATLALDDDLLCVDEEILHGCDPCNADTDGDGLDDAAEVREWNSCPWKADSDGDGIVDGADARPLAPDGCMWFLAPDDPLAYEPGQGTYTLAMLPHLPPRDWWVDRSDKPFYQYGTIGVSYAHDRAGNVITSSVGGAVTVFRYDAMNNLARIDCGDGATWYELLHDSLGRRIGVRRNGGAWRYDIHAGGACIASVTNGAVAGFFVRPVHAEGAPAHGDPFLANVIAEIDAAGQTHYHVANHRGDTVAVLDGDAVVEAAYRYDAFGNVTIESGSFLPRDAFCGYEYLPEPNLYLSAWRAYDPLSGRWLQRDPYVYRDSANLYQFRGNAPVSPAGVDAGGGVTIPGSVPSIGNKEPPVSSSAAERDDPDGLAPRM